MDDLQTVSTQCSASERDYVLAHFVHLRPRPMLKLAGWGLLLLFLTVLGLMAQQMVRRHTAVYAPFPWLLFIAAYLAVLLLVVRAILTRHLRRVA
jgi:hypothetical protein